MSQKPESDPSLEKMREFEVSCHVIEVTQDEDMKKWFAGLALPCFGVSCWMVFKHMGFLVLPPLVVGWMLLVCAFISRRGPDEFGKLWGKVRYEICSTIKGVFWFAFEMFINVVLFPVWAMAALAATYKRGAVILSLVCVAVAFALRFSGGHGWHIWPVALICVATFLDLAALFSRKLLDG